MQSYISWEKKNDIKSKTCYKIRKHKDNDMLARTK